MMEVLQGIPAEKRAKWSRLSMLSDRCGSAGASAPCWCLAAEQLWGVCPL